MPRRWEENWFEDMLGNRVDCGDPIVYGKGLGHAFGNTCGLGMARVLKIEREENFQGNPRHLITVRAVIYHNNVPSLAGYPVILHYPDRIAKVSGFHPSIEELFRG